MNVDHHKVASQTLSEESLGQSVLTVLHLTLFAERFEALLDGSTGTWIAALLHQVAHERVLLFGNRRGGVDRNDLWPRYHGYLPEKSASTEN